MFSFFTRNIVTRVSSSFGTISPGTRLSILAVNHGCFGVSTRRSFFNLSRVDYAASAAAVTRTKPAKASSKSSPKSAGKKSTKPKAASKKKKKHVSKEGVKKPYKLTKEDLPPSGAPNSWILFYREFFNSKRSEVKTLSDTANLAREAAARWKDLNAIEKQPYVDKSESLKAERKEKMAKYIENVNSEVLSAVNKKRRAQGMKRIYRLPQNARPLTAYMRFVADFRSLPEAQRCRAENPKRPAISVSILAGSKWRMMSETEKAPYKEEADKDLAAWREKTGHNA